MRNLDPSNGKMVVNIFSCSLLLISQSRKIKLSHDLGGKISENQCQYLINLTKENEYAND